MYFIFHFFCLQLIKFYKKLFSLKFLSQHSFPFPILSVGNVSLGGTGKTPFIYYLAQLCCNLKIKHVIVSRGYKKTSSGLCIVHDGNQLLCTDPLIAGDEPVMLAFKLKQTPIIVDNKKQRALSYVKQAFPKHLVLLDDSFQSHYIIKNFEIVLFNSLLQKQALRLFPFGQLREPLTALSRANLIVFTKQNLQQKQNSAINTVLNIVKKHNIPYFYSDFSFLLTKYSIKKQGSLRWETTPLQQLPKNNLLLLCCGIGDPESFKQTVQQYKPNICKSLVFSDHYNYHKNEKAFIGQIQHLYSQHSFNGLLTTEKDFVKIKSLSSSCLSWFAHKKINLFIVDIKIQLQKEGAFIDYIKNLAP